MSDHRGNFPAARIEHASIRRANDSAMGYTIEADPNEHTGLVEVWIDGPTAGETAIANLRITPTAARLLAEQLLSAAERATS